MGVTITRRVAALLVLAAVLAGPASAALKGADVSHWNGTVDWLQFSNAGYSFAFLKATEGTSIVDPTYPINRADAATFGVRTGAYHFARPAGSGDAAVTANAIAQADRYVDVAGLKPGDLPPALDLETNGGLATAPLQQWTQAWLDEVYARTGSRAVVYFSPNFWKSSVGDTAAFAQQGYRLWIAHWKVAAPTVPGANWGGAGWTFWQWTNCESIPGFLHCVDGDRFAGSSLGTVAVPSTSGTPTPGSTPTVVGTPQAGKLLAAVPGAWSGGRPIGFAYQWQSCDAAGAGCVPIAGATGETYTPSAADAGHALVVSVTAQNASGSVSVSSGPTVAVASGGTGGALAPVATSPPTIAGTAQAGQQLTASVGTWSGSPTSFGLQWRRCDSAGTGCAAIPGAISGAYTLTPGDIGSTLSLLVTATGPGGSRTAASPATAAIAAAPVPAAVPGSLVAAVGQAGAVATTDGSATVTWQPGAVPTGASVALTAGTRKLALPRTALALVVSAPLAWPVDVHYAAAPADAVPGLAEPRGVWQALPELTAPALAPEQQAGVYRGPDGLHLITRVGGTFALFAPGKWGDPRKVAAGPPVLKRLTPITLRGSGSSFLVATRLLLASQSHLYLSLGAHRQQALVRAPGGWPLRFRVPAGAIPHATRVNLRIVAVDPYGRKAFLVLPLRRR